MIRVVIADDHGLVREGLRQLVDGPADIEVVGTAASGREAVDLIERTRPDVALMDLSMPDTDGIVATREALGRAPKTNVVILTSFSDRSEIMAALDSGASGYLLKDAEPQDLLAGVRAAARGDSPLAPRAAREVLSARTEERPTADLSPRERDVLRLVGQGLPNKRIALELEISEKTVKAHLTNIFQRIGVSDRTQAAMFAKVHRLS